jgi:arylsulfatase A-like enzyme
MSFARPHQPYTPSEPYASMYDPDGIHLPPTAETESAALRYCRDSHRYGPFDEATLRHKVASYLGCVSQVDAAIGLVLDDLSQRGQLDNTIIVYAADHGDHAGEHGMYEKKAGISARSICRTPLIVRYPSMVAGGHVRDEIVEAVDVLPTICELAGIDAPTSAQGLSAVPLLGQQPRPIRADALTENRLRKSLATPRYRYVANIDDEPDELYDLVEDPWEQRNRIDDPALSGVARDLSRRLRQRLAEARRPVTAFRGGWLGHRYDQDGRLDADSVVNPTPYD